MQGFAERIKSKREELGLSQAALGRKIGVSQQTIAGLESGRFSRTSHTFSLAEALGVSAEWLMKGEQKPTNEVVKVSSVKEGKILLEFSHYVTLDQFNEIAKILELDSDDG